MVALKSISHYKLYYSCFLGGTLLTICWLSANLFYSHAEIRTALSVPLTQSTDISTTLVKRVSWSWFKGAAAAGIVMAAGYDLRSNVVPAVCLASGGGPLCVYIGNIIGAVVITGVAAFAARDQNGSVSQKRDSSRVRNIAGHNIVLSSWTHQNQTIDVGGESGTLIFHQSVQVYNTALSKRDFSTNYQGIVFSSNLGNHIALSPLHSPEELSVLVANAQPNVPFVNNTISKRDYPTDGFEVDWVSYNYDNGNVDLSRDWLNNQPQDEDLSYLEGEIQDWLSKNRGWKYCVAADMARDGEAIDYDDIQGVGPNTGNALHGEVYFNTYGGVDGFCNDNEDGAQDSDGR